MPDPTQDREQVQQLVGPPLPPTPSPYSGEGASNASALTTDYQNQIDGVFVAPVEPSEGYRPRRTPAEQLVAKGFVPWRNIHRLDFSARFERIRQALLHLNANSGGDLFPAGYLD